MKVPPIAILIVGALGLILMGCAIPLAAAVGSLGILLGYVGLGLLCLAAALLRHFPPPSPYKGRHRS